MRIAVLKNWDEPDPARQWPRRPPPEFSEISFDFTSPESADFVVALNGVREDVRITVPADRVWAMIQEPPNPFYVDFHRGQPAFSRIYTTDSGLRDARHVPFFGALQWRVDRSFDELAAAAYPAKTRTLSWITSNQSRFDGHKLRMNFLRRLERSGLPFDLYGQGFTPIADKWDGLAPYRYSIAFENFADDLYWSEKLADCFLAFTTPFYFGTASIGRYFPKGSYIPIDPYDRHVFERMREKIAEGFHDSHRAALEEARELCLTRYNTLFYIAREALAHAAKTPVQTAREVLIEKLPPSGPSSRRWPLHLRQRVRRLWRRMKRRR